MPGDYPEKPAEALVMFWRRYLEILVYEGSIRMCRMSMAETARFPEQAAQLFDVLFTQVQARLSVYPEDNVWAFVPRQCRDSAQFSRPGSLPPIPAGAVRHGPVGRELRPRDPGAGL